MQVSVESLSSLERRMTVQVPAEKIDGEVETRLKSMVGKVRLDGFRPGKVPLNVIRQRFSSGVYQEVLGEVLQSTFQEAVLNEKLLLAGMPEIDPGTPQPGEELEYTATFEVYPEIELADLSQVELTVQKAEIVDADIDRMLDNLRKQQQSWSPVERVAKDGDQIVVDFEGSIDGEKFEGGKAENMPLVLGEGRMIPGFEEPLVGMKAGDEKSIDVTFPEDYQAKDLTGKLAQFAIKVSAVNEATLPEIDEEFVKAFGIEDGSVEKLREDARSNMQRELDQAITQNLKGQVMDALIDKHDIEVPQAMVKEETTRLSLQTQASMGQQAGANPLPDDLFSTEAKRRVVLGLVIGEIVKTNDIKLDDSRVQSMLQEMASSYQEPQVLIQYYRDNPQQMEDLRAAAMEEQVVEWVREQATIKEQASSFEEIMTPAPNQEEAA